MRREGYIIEEIIEYSNMSEAFDSVLRGTGKNVISGQLVQASKGAVLMT